MPSNADCVTRFAPSPTGHLHIGGARTALFCLALARRRGGRFLLRVEDTDQRRSSENAARGILEDLAWLGLGWDDGPEFHAPGVRCGGDERGVGPFHQAQRLGVYQRFIQRLVDADLAYPAFESPDELGAMRAEALAKKETFRYKRPSGFDRPAALARMASEPHVVRFSMPAEPVLVQDEVLGEIEFTEEHTDDFVIQKRDGFPTYHLAVVVDDELMGVTHVIRGQEHLNNTPRHVALQRALRNDDGAPFRTPVYGHLPLVFNADGSKMSKRDKDKAVKAAVREQKVERSPVPSLPDADFDRWRGDKQAQLDREAVGDLAERLGVHLPEIDVEDFRAAGYLPEALLNFIALLGWNPGEKNEDGTDRERFSLGEIQERFALGRVGKTASKFDRDKLLSFNMQRLTTMPPEAFVERLRAWSGLYAVEMAAMDPGRFEVFARAVQPQCKTLREASDRARFIFLDPSVIEYDEKASKKFLLKGEPSGVELLSGFAKRAAGIDEAAWTEQTLHDCVEHFCEAEQVGMGKIAQPLRLALTGTAVSPAIDATLAVLGREQALARISRCVAHFGSQGGADVS